MDKAVVLPSVLVLILVGEILFQMQVALELTVCIDVPGPSLLSSQTQENSAKPPNSSTTPQPQQAPLPQKPNYDPFASLTSSHPSSRKTTPGPASLLHSQQTTRPQQQSSDPFTALSSPAPQQPVRFPNSQGVSIPAPSPSASIFDFAVSKPPQPQPHSNSNPQQTSNGIPADDDWNFASALPDESASLPETNELMVADASVNIAFEVKRPSFGARRDTVITIAANFSNNTDALVTEYTFQVAVTKVRLDQSFRNTWLLSLTNVIVPFRVLR